MELLVVIPSSLRGDPGYLCEVHSRWQLKLACLDTFLTLQTSISPKGNHWMQPIPHVIITICNITRTLPPSNNIENWFRRCRSNALFVTQCITDMSGEASSWVFLCQQRKFYQERCPLHLSVPRKCLTVPLNVAKFRMFSSISLMNGLVSLFPMLGAIFSIFLSLPALKLVESCGRRQLLITTLAMCAVANYLLCVFSVMVQYLGTFLML